MTRAVLMGFAVVLLAGCAGGGRGGLTNMFCGMRESACEQRCEAMRADEQLACRRSCADDAKDRCG